MLKMKSSAWRLSLGLLVAAVGLALAVETGEIQGRVVDKAAPACPGSRSGPPAPASRALEPA